MSDAIAQAIDYGDAEAMPAVYWGTETLWKGYYVVKLSARVRRIIGLPAPNRKRKSKGFRKHLRTRPTS